MIVSCQRCGTSFQLDDSRVPLSGIRVRCSRCKQAFFLQHPDASQSEAVHDVANDTLEVGRAPEATQDLSTENDRSREHLANSGGEFEEEDDWEFNEDFPSESDDDDGSFGSSGEVSGSTDDDVFGHGDVGFSAFDDSEQSLELDTGDSSGADSSADAGTDDDTSAFGTVEDYSELMEDEEAVVDQGDVRELADEAPADLSAESEPAPARARGEDLGDPEDWDFFSDESLETVGNGVTNEHPVDPGVVQAWGELEQKMSVSSGDARTSQGGEGTKGLNERLSQAGAALGWLCTVALIAVGVTQGLVSGPTSNALVPASLPVGDMVAEGVEGHWLDTARMGTVFVVTGQLRNPSREQRRVRGDLQVALLDGHGARLGHPPAPMGVEIGRRTLREGAASDLQEVQLRASRALGKASLAPGAAVNVMAVFPELPEDAMRFDIELVADARPASPPAPTAPAAKAPVAESRPTEAPAGPGVRRIPLPSSGS